MRHVNYSLKPVVIDNAQRAAACFGWAFPIHAGSDRPPVGELVTAQNILNGTQLWLTSLGGGVSGDCVPVFPGPTLESERRNGIGNRIGMLCSTEF